MYKGPLDFSWKYPYLNPRCVTTQRGSNQAVPRPFLAPDTSAKATSLEGVSRAGRRLRRLRRSFAAIGEPRRDQRALLGGITGEVGKIDFRECGGSCGRADGYQANAGRQWARVGDSVWASIVNWAQYRPVLRFLLFQCWHFCFCMIWNHNSTYLQWSYYETVGQISCWAVRSFIMNKYYKLIYFKRKILLKNADLF